MTDTDYTDDITAILIEAGFDPMEADSDTLADEYTNITRRDAKVLDYFAERGWDAWRLEGAGFTLVRWGDDGIYVIDITRNGVTNAEARFTFNAKGVAWLTAAVAS